MGYSRRALITAAYAEIGLGDYVYNLQPGDLQIAARRLDAMMAEWNARGIRLAWAIPGQPGGGDIDADTALPDAAYEAVILNLALRLAPGLGKTISRDTASLAKRALDTVTAHTMRIPRQPLPATLPAGAGNKPWRQMQPFVYPDRPGIDAGDDGPIEWS